MMSAFDITIVGAGPTGLFSAILARQQGLSVCIIDKKDGPLEVGRADALNARTQQILDFAGVLKDLRPIGLQCNTSSIFKDGAFLSHNNKWWVNLKNTQYKEFLMIGQSDIEKAMVKNLDIDIRYGTVAGSITESSEGVSIHIGTEVIHSKYVIGADGAHSSVRKQLGIEFLGDKPNMCWAVLDTFLTTDFPVCDEIINFEENGQSRVSWIPRERGMARFYVLLDGEVNQERSEAAVRSHMAPYNVSFTKTEWFSTYNVQERVAETYLSPLGRIVLAGDAAHVHAVNGGQGLNTGVSDAFALAWRISLAIKGFSKTAVRTYDEERRTTARGVVDVAGKLVRSTLRSAQEYVDLVEKNAANITGMGITYGPSSAGIVTGCVGDFLAGGRSPDFEFLKSGVVPIRFYESIRPGKFTVLKPTSMDLSLPEILSSYVDVWVWTRDEDVYIVVTPLGAKLTTRFDLGAGDVAIVVRPDLYTGFVGDGVAGYFSDFLLG